MKKLSRLLSYVLRHKPEKIGIGLDAHGWTDISKLILQLKEYGYEVTLDELKEIVKSNDKQRFSIDEDLSKIRANQGHSVKVDLQLENKRPPAQLYHGTPKYFVESIFKHGLSKKTRHAVHLSEDVETAIAVGSRRGEFEVFVINSGLMHFDGYKFQQSANGVWLTESVPAKYIKGVIQSK